MKLPRIVGRAACIAALLLPLRPGAAAADPAPASGGWVYAVRWSTLPQKDRVEDSAYGAWSRVAIPRGLAVPGVRELRTFRAAAGEPHILTLFAFDSLAALAAWRASPVVDSLVGQARQLTYELASEIWGPSPWLPAPLVPAGRDPAPGGHALYIMSWSVAPDRDEDYARWVRAAVARWAAAPEILSVSAWRVVAGAHADVVAFEFPGLEAWARWYADGEVQKTRIESRELIVDVRSELWGPNPLIPRPLHPAAAR